MSWLRFERKAGKIEIFAGGAPGNFVSVPQGSWPAHNKTAKSSKGAWPKGMWTYSHTNPHAEMGLAPACHASSYGCSGIHVFTVPGRTGMGVHAGRTFGQDDVVGGVTLGCVRVPDNAMVRINEIHAADPLLAIVVAD